MKSRIIFGLFALAILCGCNEQPVDENIPFEPIGDLYPAPTEDTEYELVEDVDICGYYSEVLFHGSAIYARDIRYARHYSNEGENYYCGCEVEDPELKHIDIYTTVLLKYDMPFSTQPGGCYYWYEAYQGLVDVDPQWRTPEGYKEINYMLDFERNHLSTNRGDYDVLTKFFYVHTSTQDYADIDLIFDLRIFDKTTGKYYKSNKFHLTVEPFVVQGEGYEYVEYNAKVEKMLPDNQ